MQRGSPVLARASPHRGPCPLPGPPSSHLRNDRNVNAQDIKHDKAHISQNHTMVSKCLSTSEVCSSVSRKVGRQVPFLETSVHSETGSPLWAGMARLLSQRGVGRRWMDHKLPRELIFSHHLCIKARKASPLVGGGQAGYGNPNKVASWTPAWSRGPKGEQRSMPVGFSVMMSPTC